MPAARGPFSAARRPPARAVLRRAVTACLASIDALEPRRLLASNLAGGVLTVDGTGGDDDIRLNLSSGQIVVTLNRAADGAFDPPPWPARPAHAADGSDATPRGNKSNGTLDGGAGNDTVDGKEGSDVLIGGAGFDAADYRFETADLTLSIDDTANEAGGNAAGDNITTSIERIVGGSGND